MPLEIEVSSTPNQIDIELPDATLFNTLYLKRTPNDFNTFTEKTPTLANNDRILIEDSADGGKKKYIKISTIKTATQTGIGTSISGGADKSILYIAGSNLAQDPIHFTYDQNTVQVQLITAPVGAVIPGVFISGAGGVTIQSPSLTEQLRIARDASNYVKFELAPTGDLTLTPTGSGAPPKLHIAGPLTVQDEIYNIAWAGSTETPTKGALYNVIQTLTGGTPISYYVMLSAYANLAAAISAIGTTPVLLVIDENTTVTAPVVVPATCLLKFVKGSVITITNPGTIEFKGQGIAQEDLDGKTQLFDLPQPLVWNGNVTAVRNSTTITQNGNNYDAVSARDAGRFVYMPDVGLQTTVASVANIHQLVLSQAVPTADFALAPLSGSFTATANNDTFTLANHGFGAGQRVRLTGGSLPAGVVANTTYFVIVTGRDTFKLATTFGNATSSSVVPINLTADGSGSITATNTDSFAAVGATDIFTTTQHRLGAGQAVQLSGGSLPTGVVAATNYYAITHAIDNTLTFDNFKLATTYANAIANVPINITSDGSGTWTAESAIVIDETNSNLDQARGYFTKRGHGLVTGYKVQLTMTGTLPNGFATGTDYWAVKQTDDTFRLAATERDAFAGTYIPITDAGIGSMSIDATLPGSNDFNGAFAYVYNLAWTGSVYPNTISTTIFGTSSMGNEAIGGTSQPYINAGLSGVINAAGLALANKPATIRVYPTDLGFTFYAATYPTHVLEFQAGHFTNSNFSQASLAYFSNTTIRGKGKFDTIIDEPSSQGLYPVFDSATNTGATRHDRIENVEISDLQILGQPRPQLLRGTTAESAATVQGAKVKNVNVHDLFLNKTSSLGMFFGEGIGGGSATETYSEDIRLTDNWFYNIPTQAIGVTAGSGIEVSRNHINLSSPYDSSAISVIDIEPNGSLSSTDALSGIVVNDNFIDTRNRHSSPINGINIVNGEWRGFRGVVIDGNTFMSATPDAVSSGTPVSGTLSNDIIVNQVMGGSISNNKVFGSADLRGIWVNQSGYLTIKNNVFHAAGYNATVQLDGSSNNYVADNVAYDGPIPNVAHPTIQENTQTVTVNRTGTAVTFVSSPDISFFTAAYVNGVIRISGVDYEISAVTSDTTLTLKTGAGSESNIVSTIRPVLNKYKDNTISTYNLVDTGTYSSVIYSRFSDFRKTGTVTIDPGSIAANTVSSQTFTLTGAKTGDSLVLNPPAAGVTLGLLVLQSFVSAADMVTVVFQNTTVAAVDEPSGTWNYTLFR